ncbi:NlpC/P60 family protein [Ruminococcus sp.]|uniref:C40 family peptidase n=1 Tax=Ruminococcus sp. TaxID=41978 RepID=UPI0025EBD3B3|nr:NlpC/P60 family protein [Ruminococcus sp.]MBQ8965792.1 C40 family peptidase [Ruminococcus sp.]
MIHGKNSVSRLLALCLTLTLTVGAVSVSSGYAINGSADKQADSSVSELDSLKAQQQALDMQIEQAQKEIDKQKDDLDALKIKYTAVKAKIDNVEEQLTRNEDAMVELDTRLRDARNDLEIKNAEIEELRTEFMARLKTMYLAGGSSTYENVLVNSSDFFDVLMRVELVKRVAEHDDEALDTLMEKKREIEAVEAEIEADAEQLKEQTAQYSSMRDELNAEKKSLAEVIKEADGKLDTLALDKEAMELRNSELIQKQAEEILKAKAEDKSESKSEESKTSDEKSEGARTTKQTTAVTEKEKPAETVTEKSAETTKQTTAVEKQTEAEKPVTEKTETKTVTEKQTEPPVTETEPVIVTEEPYVEPEPEPEPEPLQPVDDSRQAKIDIVMDYARSNVGGSYVWAGSSFRATDCSGLVMLSYAQIGINMTHLASIQATYGTPVSYDELQEGDLVFFGSGGDDIYHVAIYNGGGRIVHAANSNDGIIFSDLASFAQYNPICCMRRII